MSTNSQNITQLSNLINSSNPMYLHPFDHLGMLLVSKQFDRSNFNSWKKEMMIDISTRNKIGFVNGKISNLHLKAKHRRIGRDVKIWLRLDFECFIE